VSAHQKWASSRGDEIFFADTCKELQNRCILAGFAVRNDQMSGKQRRQRKYFRKILKMLKTVVYWQASLIAATYKCDANSKMQRIKNIFGKA